MIVEGAVVMVENIVRLLSQETGPGQAEESVAQKIRRGGPGSPAAGVFFVAIIITAYCPSSRCSAWSRLFEPMAWTVAFALLGALLFLCFWRR